MKESTALVTLICFGALCFTVYYCLKLMYPDPQDCHDWARMSSSGIGAPEFQELFDTCMKERGQISVP